MALQLFELPDYPAQIAVRDVGVFVADGTVCKERRVGAEEDPPRATYEGIKYKIVAKQK